MSVDMEMIDYDLCHILRLVLLFIVQAIYIKIKKLFFALSHVCCNPVDKVADLSVDSRVVISATPNTPAHNT